MRNLPTSDDDKYPNTIGSKVSDSFVRNHILLSISLNQVSKSSVALDLAQLSQQNHENSAEWDHFNGHSRGPPGIALRSERRIVTNPNLTLSTPSDDFSIKPLTGNASASSTPLVVEPPRLVQFPLSRRNSPPGLVDNLSTTTRSVPTTPLGLSVHPLNSSSPLIPDIQPLSARIGTPGSQHVADAFSGSNDLQASLTRMPSNNGGLGFNAIQPGPDEVRVTYLSMGWEVDTLLVWS